jgi:hypothetical protein
MATQKQNFVDQQVRPAVEALETLGVRIETLITQLAILDPPIENDATPYDDGRPNENLDPVTEAQLTSVISGLNDLNNDIIIPAGELIRRIAVRQPI